MSTLTRRRILLALGSPLLAATLLILGLLLLANSQVHACCPPSTYSAEFGIIKRPGVSTSFVVTNTGASPAEMTFNYFLKGSALIPVHTTVEYFAAGEGKFYDVGTIPELPSPFYGWLRIVSDQTIEVKIISPNKLIKGRVLYAAGATRCDDVPVTDALVVAHRDGSPDVIETHTDENGDFRIPVDGGRWLLDVVPAPGITSTDWIYADPPQVVEFDLPPEKPEVRLVVFRVLQADGHLTGHVRLPLPEDGTLAGLPVRVIARDSVGIGNEVWTDPAGEFDLQVPQGVYNVFVRPATPVLAGPQRNGVVITTSTDVGNVYLMSTTVVITGQVTDAAGNVLSPTLHGVTGPAKVVAWERHGAGWGMVETDHEGFYTLPLAVKPGLPTEWMIRVVPPPVASGKPPFVAPKARRIILRAGARREANFRLLPADGHIVGHVVNENDKHLCLLGRAQALRYPYDSWPRHFYAPMYKGYFTLTVPTTHTYNMIYDVGVRPDPTSGYAPGYVRGVDPPTSGDEFITVTLHKRDAAIVGALVDATQLPTVTHIVTGVEARVFAVNRPRVASEGDWQSRRINSDSGTYRMGVVSGTWRLDFRVEHPQLAGWIPHPRFRHDPAWHLHTVSSTHVVTANLPVLPLDRRVTGTVRLLGSSGLPVPFVKVCGRGIDPSNENIELCTQTNRWGSYRLRTTPGHYLVRVILPQALRDKGLLAPDAEIANPNEGDVNFVVRRANATVQGNVTISTTAALTQPKVLVWGWSLGGSHVFTEVVLPEDAGGTVFLPAATYALGVAGSPAGDVWYLGARYESGGIIYRSPRQRVVVHAGDVISLDLTLASIEDLLGRLPEPTSVTFDRSLGVMLELDQITIQIPAGAIPASTDEVTLDIYPLALAPEQRFEEVIGFGYALSAYDGDGNPIVERFYENVAITLPYSETLLAAMGIDEEDILPAYLSTTTGRWTAPENYSVDTLNDEVTLYVDHFTDFVLTGEPSLQTMIYLPIIMQSFDG